jgi:hypothetical protein
MGVYIMAGNTNGFLGGAFNRHLVSFVSLLIVGAITWGVLITRVDALEEDEKNTILAVDKIASKVNEQEVSIAEIKVGIQNMEKNQIKIENNQDKIQSSLAEIAATLSIIQRN